MLLADPQTLTAQPGDGKEPKPVREAHSCGALCLAAGRRAAAVKRGRKFGPGADP